MRPAPGEVITVYTSAEELKAICKAGGEAAGLENQGQGVSAVEVFLPPIGAPPRARRMMPSTKLRTAAGMHVRRGLLQAGRGRALLARNDPTD